MIDFKHRAFSAKIIDNGQHPKAPAVVKAVRDKIHGPMLVDPLWSIHDYPEVADALPTLLKSQREAFLTVEALCAFVVDQTAFPAKHDMQAWGTELTPLFCKFAQA